MLPLFVRLSVGATPGPILVGVMMDGACLQWQHTCTSEGSAEGACWIYNNENLSWRMFGLGLIMKVAAVSLFSLALFFYRPADGTDEANEAVAAADAAGTAAERHSGCAPSDVPERLEEMVPLDAEKGAAYKQSLQRGDAR